MVKVTYLQTCQSKKKKKPRYILNALWCKAKRVYFRVPVFIPPWLWIVWFVFLVDNNTGNNKLDWEQQCSLHSLCDYTTPPLILKFLWEGKRRKGNNSLPHPWNLSIFHQFWDLHSLIPFTSAPIRLGPLFCLENISQSFPYDFYTLA